MAKHAKMVGAGGVALVVKSSYCEEAPGGFLILSRPLDAPKGAGFDLVDKAKELRGKAEPLEGFEGEVDTFKEHLAARLAAEKAG